MWNLRLTEMAFLGVLGLATYFAAPSVGWGSNLDRELVTNASEIRKLLRERNYKTVGVLKFGVKTGDGRMAFHGRLANNSMAERLEQALILAVSPRVKAPVEIIHKAGKTAAEQLKRATYRTEEGRKRLFEVDYRLPLAGRPPVRADAFLFGEVSVGKDSAKSTIVLKVFDKENPERITELLSFDVALDQLLRIQLGQGFVAGARGAESELLTKRHWERLVEKFPVELNICYAEKEQKLKPDFDADGFGSVVADPREGERVTFRLRNKTDTKLGVVLAVNGQSIFEKEEGRPEQLRRWVLDPGAKFSVRGFYREIEGGEWNIREIVGSSEDCNSGTEGCDLGPTVGLVHLYVFTPTSEEEKPHGVAGARGGPDHTASDRKDAGGEGPALTWMELSSRVAHEWGGHNRSRSLMVPGDEQFEGDEIEEGELGPVELAGVMIVRYHGVAERD